MNLNCFVWSDVSLRHVEQKSRKSQTALDSVIPQDQSPACRFSPTCLSSKGSSPPPKCIPIYLLLSPLGSPGWARALLSDTTWRCCVKPSPESHGLLAAAPPRWEPSYSRAQKSENGNDTSGPFKRSKQFQASRDNVLLGGF